MKKKFSEVYHLYCEIVEESIREKLGRPLTEIEHYGIWNTGSLLLLELFERDLISARSIEEVVMLLARQAQTSQEALEKVLENLIERIAGVLQRSLSYEEKQKLHAIQMVEEAMRVVERLNEIFIDQREFAFQNVLDNLSPKYQ